MRKLILACLLLVASVGFGLVQANNSTQAALGLHPLQEDINNVYLNPAKLNFYKNTILLEIGTATAVQSGLITYEAMDDLTVGLGLRNPQTFITTSIFGNFPAGTPSPIRPLWGMQSTCEKHFTIAADGTHVEVGLSRLVAGVLVDKRGPLRIH